MGAPQNTHLGRHPSPRAPQPPASKNLGRSKPGASHAGAHAGRKPAHALTMFPSDDPTSFFSKQRAYLEHAYEVSYLMQGKSGAETALDWVEHVFSDNNKRKPPRIQSFLGGAFLRMYLDHKVDPDIVQTAGAEIGQSPEFAKLQAEMTTKCQAELPGVHTKHTLTEQIAALYGKDLDRIRKKHGIAFKYTLNPVIGGVTGVKVSGARIVGKTPKGKNVEVSYDVDVVFSDVYDFTNKRQGVYEAYRKRLALLLAFNDFSEFEKEYFTEVQPIGKFRANHLDNAAVFASFMYALEKKGWTPGGLPWEVTVPMHGTVTLPETRVPR
jgi:hypothetical protein